MAIGEMIGAAIGILMLIIVAYLVVGSTLSTSELVVNTQKEITQQNEERLNTAITITDAHYHYTGVSPDRWRVDITASNSGSEPIGDFNYMDVYITNGTAPPERFAYDAAGVGAGGSYYTRNWSYTAISPDTIHPKMLDPGEELNVIRILNFRWEPYNYPVVTVIAPNGATAMGTIYAY